jgi:hypothetical protein
MVIMVNRPLEPFKDELYTLLKVQSAEIDAMNATHCQFLDHVDRELDAIVFHELVVMLRKDEVTTTRDLQDTTHLDLIEVCKDRGWYGGATEFRYPKEGRVGLYRHDPRDNRHGDSYRALVKNQMNSIENN